MTLIEEVKVLYSAKKNEPTIKDLFLRSRGLAVTVDYFLYTCLEQEHTLKHLNKRRFAQYNDLRYPMALQLQERAPDEQEADIESTLSALFSSYKAKFPEFSSDEPFDYVSHAELLRPMTLFFIDLRLVLTKGLGIKGPFFGERASASERQKQAYDSLKTGIEREFPRVAKYLLAYCEWAFSEVKKKVLDLKSLPPVGRYLPLLYRSQRKAERDAIMDKRKPPRKESAEQQHLKAALTEVEQAIEKMRSDESLSDIVLAPQNSFVRRQQHEKVKSLGFNSQSSGEGEARALQILRS